MPVHSAWVFHAADLPEDAELRVAAGVAALWLVATTLLNHPRHVGTHELLDLLLLEGLAPTRRFSRFWRRHGSSCLIAAWHPWLWAHWLALAVDLVLGNFLALGLVGVLPFELLMVIKVWRCTLVLLVHGLWRVLVVAAVLGLAGCMVTEGVLPRELLLLLLLGILTVLTLILRLLLLLVELHLLVGLWNVLLVLLAGGITCLLCSVVGVGQVLVAHLLLGVLEVLRLLVEVAVECLLLWGWLLLLLATLIRLSLTYLHLNKDF